MTVVGRPLRVLLVDDEPDVRLLVRTQLRSEHAIEVVGEAGDGAAAVAECERVRPDAVVMDLLMPGTNGFEAIEALRRRAPEIAVVAFSAVDGEHVRAEMTRLGIPFVLKGQPARDLIDALRRAVRAGAA